MASPIVGTVLCVGIVFACFASLVSFATTDHWSLDRCNEKCQIDQDLTWEEYSEKCNCQPPKNPDGSNCEPISIPDQFGIAWKCDLKPLLGGY